MINIQFILPLLYALPFYFLVSSLNQFFTFLIGLYLGVALLVADEKWLYKFYIEKSDLARSDYKVQLVTRSMLFLLVYIPLSIFVITSSGSLIGQGLILGMGIIWLVEMWKLKNNQQAFTNRFLLQVKKEFSLDDIKKLVLVATGFFVLLTILVLL